MFLRRHWPLLLILLLAGGLRLYGIERSPLWTDELFSLQSSAGRGFWVEEIPRGELLSPAPRPTALAEAGPPWAIVAGQATDTHPPLYFLILRLTRALLGDAVWAVRLPSVLAGLGLVAGLYAAAYLSAGRAAAIVAALLTTLATPLIIYAQEARGYMLALALAAVATAAAIAIVQRGLTRGRGLLLGASAGLAVATTYLLALPLLATALYVVLAARPEDRRRVFGVVAVSVALTAAALGPLLVRQVDAVPMRNLWLVSETPRTIGAVAADASAAVLGQLAPIADRTRIVAHAFAALLLLAVVVTARRNRETALFAGQVLAVLASLAIWDLAANKTHLELPRYTLAAAPGVIGLLATLRIVTGGGGGGVGGGAGSGRVGAGAVLGRWLPLAAWVAVLLPLVSLPEAYRVTKEDFPAITRYVAAGHARPDDLFVVAAFGGRRWDHILYLALSRYLPEARFTAAILDSPDQDLAPLRAEVERRGRVVLFLEHGTEPQGLVPGHFRRTGFDSIPLVGALVTLEAGPERP